MGWIDGAVNARQAGLPEGEDRLAENRAVGDEPLPSNRIPKGPPLVITRVANQNTVSGVRSQSGTLILLQVSVHGQPKGRMRETSGLRP